jgi:hypothetical protein
MDKVYLFLAAAHATGAIAYLALAFSHGAGG